MQYIFQTFFKFSVCFRHLAYHRFADGADEYAFIPAREIIVQEQLLIFQPERAYDVLVHDVRNEELRQGFGMQAFIEWIEKNSEE